MRAHLLFILLFGLYLSAHSQTNTYRIAFPNAVHHEAHISVTFPGIEEDTLEVWMSRSSPGRYALHEFAKNVYGFKATDGQGNPLQVHRPNPYSWRISGHDGTAVIQYYLFANRGDGTYSQIDESHAHLNIPATFMFAPALQDRALEVTFVAREDLGWKIATQLPRIGPDIYAAPNLQYFMDSPVELSNFSKREFMVSSGGRNDTIAFVLHHQGSEAALDRYFEQVKKIVVEAKEVFGELPDFDYGRYTFLACYMPQVAGDGMEHRNSTIVTSTTALENGGAAQNIGTVAHEFFHAWNVERLRPASLEPFNFTRANMSGALWFAEGFTSYYTDLILCRAGIISEEAYISGLTRPFNYVWTAPGRMFNNPIEMSYQAPFVDAANSIDPHNTANIFISYYTYGKMLGLALDLALRRQQLSLDGYMRLLWKSYGTMEVPYTLANLHEALVNYAGKTFGDHFFDNYIYNSGMPDYRVLFESVGLFLSPDPDGAYLGVSLAVTTDGSVQVEAGTLIGTPAYEAGLEKDDLLTSLNGRPLNAQYALSEALKMMKAGDNIDLGYMRRGQEKSTVAVLKANPAQTVQLLESTGAAPTKEALENRRAWLNY